MNIDLEPQLLYHPNVPVRRWGDGSRVLAPYSPCPMNTTNNYQIVLNTLEIALETDRTNSTTEGRKEATSKKLEVKNGYWLLRREPLLWRRLRERDEHMGMHKENRFLKAIWL